MIIDLFAGPGGWSTGLNMLGRSEDAVPPLMAARILESLGAGSS